MEIGIIGHGVVGSALHAGFEKLNLAQRFTIYDPVTHPDPVEFKNASFVFICVPTPPYEADGSQNVSMVVEALDMLAAQEYAGLVVLKSTTLPTHTSDLVRRFNQLHIIANPEFLTARTAEADFEKQPFILVGGDECYTLRLVALYRRYWFDSDIRWVPSAMGAMMVKYMLNCFFAIKVTIFNEFFNIWESIGDIPWDHVIAAFKADDRVADSHTLVPGPDGQFGFGGACFPKDMKALASLAGDKGVPHNVLKMALRTNKAVRRRESGQ